MAACVLFRAHTANVTDYTIILPDAHRAEIQAINDLSHPAFADYPDAIDAPMKAGDLLIKGTGARYERSARFLAILEMRTRN